MEGMAKSRKYIFVTGGVLSGVGKGITAASIGALLKSCGLKISVQKCEAYLNVDASTLSPAEHGEAFVTKDGAELDLDLGHYERFLDIELTGRSVTMAGRVYRDLIEAERSGKFSGKTVQMIPHLTNAIQDEIKKSGEGSDIHIVELGGTIGDYESVAFIEAFREFAAKVGRENCLFVHVVYVPYIKASRELKTKPAQNAIRDLRSFGIMPDIICARADYDFSNSVLDKISMFGGVPRDAVAALPSARTIYEVPVTLERQNIAQTILKKLNIRTSQPDISSWKAVAAKAAKKYDKTIKVGIVAKYLDNEDTYYSMVEALRSAAWHEEVNVNYVWINAENERNELDECNAVLIPGGFGERGFKGKVATAKYALEEKIPFLGIGLGMQAAVVAAAKNGGLTRAVSEEINDDAKQNVIKALEKTCLGDSQSILKKNSLVANIYGKEEIIERHRHKFEVNREFTSDIEAGGLIISGWSIDRSQIELVEAKSHPYFIASQAHPEFKSRPNKPHPLFVGLIAAAKNNLSK